MMRCTDSDCAAYGKEMIDRGYNHKVCPSVPYYNFFAATEKLWAEMGEMI